MLAVVLAVFGGFVLQNRVLAAGSTDTATLGPARSNATQVPGGTLGALIAATPAATQSTQSSQPTAQATPTSVPTTAPAAASPRPAPAVRTDDPFGGATFYVDPESDAAAAVRALQSSAPADAATLSRLANGSAAAWFGDHDPATLQSRLSAWVGKLHGAGALPVVVAYGIPNRDCGGYSAGGLASPDAYRAWISAYAAGIGRGPVAVILEPDALAQIDCLSSADAQTRYALLRYAVDTLTSAGASVYIDAGNAKWHNASDMVARLRQAGVDRARGFALNVSNFDDTADELAYGDAIAGGLGGGTHFVIDTSRNGQGRAPDGAWCNPPGRGLGARPTAATGDARADAFLWIKIPGESDGTCNGGPGAGQWWLDYALGLARRSV
ncbi:glycoside hydrolase family 6 protein [Pseudofrankia sp. DC12]|uniref:glycoside hydrolase family 6 protein n=1 Tax=Pseudofrankia sp. DC12 TaxID=683315 RepID=UPI001E41FF02|nr:glycoside hydrolase family 6 protein [Pseudofrankia sp. DC12]